MKPFLLKLYLEVKLLNIRKIYKRAPLHINFVSTMLDLLTDTSTVSSAAWDFVTLMQKDQSISDFEYITLNEESHGAGSLESARRFSFTTKDREVWHLISKSYLKLILKIQKKEPTGAGANATKEYTWANADGDDVEAMTMMMVVVVVMVVMSLL